MSIFTMRSLHTSPKNKLLGGVLSGVVATADCRLITYCRPHGSWGMSLTRHP